MDKRIDWTFAGQINQSTSINEEEIYFTLTYWNNYNLFDISKLPYSKLHRKLTQIIIIIKNLSTVNNELFYFSKIKVSGIFTIRKCILTLF